MPQTNFKAEAEAMRAELVARRRDLHRHPELAFAELRTAGIVAQELNRLGLEVQTGVGKTGVVGVLEGERDGPTVLLRADMDALPIHEENETDYVSTQPGKMHACGHDGHTTIALGVAQLLARRRARLAGRVKFVFQPAEEIAQGAAAVVEDGVLHNPRPDVVLGLHLWNNLPVGRVGAADGPIMAGSSRFTIRLMGRGGHGAMPDQTIDPVLCAAQLVTVLQTIVSRNVPAMDTAVLSVTALRAGDTFNVIPSNAELKGTLRAFRTEVRDLLARRLHEVTEHVCRALGCSAEIEISHLTESVVNHPEVSARVRQRLTGLLQPGALVLAERTMGAEDVGKLMTDIPGMFLLLGSANEERGLNYGHHHPRFDFDEDALPLGVALLSAAVAEYVLPE